MGAIFRGAPKPDPSIAENQRKQQKLLDDKEAKADAKIEARKRARSGGSGARNLLANAERGGLAATLGGG